MMNTSEYADMVSMLIRATDYKKLSWTESENNFTAKVGECSIQLSIYYDTSLNINEYILTLFNSNGDKFETFNYNETDSEYSQLDTLYNSIRDSIYHITESEKDIMDSLQNMTKDIPDDLPF
ncbi:MAG: hypothetical protein LKE41_01190 [Prevotella sp.]|jgi:hypothetical protein|nr:hypothetical protein [Prevotella sp.]